VRKILLLTTTSLLAVPATAATLPPVAVTQPPATPASDDAKAPDAEPQSTQEPVTATDEIVVTAQKRAQGINDVPEAVTAFTAETRQTLGINSLQDFAKFTPGLSYDSGGDRVYLRGVGRVTNTAGSDAGVATYIDGLYDSGTSSASGSDFFVQRVEILRGPQGTLYGRNSIGGAINAISKRPTSVFSTEGRVTVANYDAQVYEASVSGPVTQGLRAKLAGSFARQGDGYFQNVAGGPSEGGVTRGYYIEGQVEANLGSRATLWIKANTNGSRGRGRGSNADTPYDYGPFPSGTITPGNAFGYLLPGYSALGSATANPGVNDIRKVSTNTTARDRLRNAFSVQGQFDLHLDPFDLRILGGYRQYTFTSVSDLDNTSMQSYQFPLSPGAVCGFIPGCSPLAVRPSSSFNYLEDRSFGSAEINLLSNGKGPFNWIVGLYYFTEKLQQTSDFRSVDQPELRAPANGPANPSGDFVYAATHLKSDSYAAFGQVDWDITSNIRLTGGLRYSLDEKNAIEQFRIVCLGCAAGLTPDQLGSFTPALDITSTVASFAPAPGVAGPTLIDPATGRARRVLIDSWSGVTGTAGIQWRPGADTLAYANYSRGYKAGGFNAGGITAVPRTNSEYVDAYQVGVKQGFGTLQLNLAGYYYKYRGLQIPLNVPQPSGIDLGQFFNLDNAKSYGIEAEATWKVSKSLQLLFNYAYSDSEIRSCCYFDGADPSAIQPGAQPSGPVLGTRRFQSLDGGELPQVPRHKLAANATYSIEFQPGTLTFSPSYTWRAKQYTSVFNRYYYQVPSFGQADARIIWTGSSGRYRIIGFVKNAFNKLGYDGVGGTAGSSVGSPYSLNLDPNYTVNRAIGVLAPRTYGVQLQLKF
jgi:iron complex outermembrane receptor protein